MIDVWLKIRDRGNKNFVLKHLTYWLALFSDTSKYNVVVYNENFQLPEYYADGFKVLNKHNLLQLNETNYLNNLVESSKISPCWKGAGFALTAPYFYFSGDNYIVNLDADDIIASGDVENQLMKLIHIMESNGLTTMSYDYILSHNVFDINRNGSKLIPHHWTFGLNISKKEKMKLLVNNVIGNADRYTQYMPSINMALEVNIDILVSNYLKHEGQHFKYWSFVTPEGFYHRGFPDYKPYVSKYTDGFFEWYLHGKGGKSPIHQKTLVIL